MTNLTKVLVTGAGGFLGSFIVRDLFNKGTYEIYTFSRKSYKNLEQYNVTQIQGDLQNPQDLLMATKGMDAIIHCASQVGMWATYETFYNTNFLGTKNIVDAAIINQVPKFIHTSTPSVAFGNESLCNVDESTPYPKKYYSYYAQTKALAEQYVLSKKSPTFSVVAIRPHLIFGPGDLNLVPRVIDSAKKGKLKIVGDGENLVDVTYVENASEVHLIALEKLSPTASMNGKAYFLGQGPIKLWDFTNDILKRSEMKPITKKIPLFVCYAIGFLIECSLKLIGKYDIHPPMTRFVAMQLGMSHYYDHKALYKDFDYTPRYSIQEGLDRLFSHQ